MHATSRHGGQSDETLNAFVVVVARRGKTVPPDVLVRLRRDRPDLHFEATSEVRWTNAGSTVVVHGWQRPNPALGIASHWSELDGGVTSFVGHVWPRRGAWPNRAPSWADQLAEARRTRTAPQLVEELTGVYAMVTLDADGRGFLLSDPLGLGMIYTGEHPDFTVYASRAALAAQVLTPAGTSPERDALGVAWLPYAAQLVGDRTGFAHVRTLLQGSYVDVTPENGTTERIWSKAPWDDGIDAQLAPEEFVDAVYDDIAQYLHAVAALPAPRKIATLTGGRDSRLVLAVLLSEGLTDAFSFETRGGETLPDVVIARELAAHFALDHQWGHLGPARRVPYEPRIKSFVHATSGMLNIWDETSLADHDDELTVTGLCGEIMRTHYTGSHNMRTRGALNRRFAGGWRHGRGLMNASVKDQLEAEARASLFDDPVGNLSPLDLMDVFFLRHRLRRWTGTEQEVDSSNRFIPLYSLAALRAAFAIGGVSRRSESLHHLLMRKCAPELVDWKFAGAGWPQVDGDARQRARNAIGAARRWLRNSTGAKRPVRDRAAAPETANQQYQRRTLSEKQGLLEQYLVGDTANPIFDVVDRPRVLDAFGRLEELGVQDRIRLFGAGTAALWMGHHDRALDPEFR